MVFNFFDMRERLLILEDELCEAVPNKEILNKNLCGTLNPKFEHHRAMHKTTDANYLVKICDVKIHITFAGSMNRA